MFRLRLSAEFVQEEANINKNIKPGRQGSEDDVRRHSVKMQASVMLRAERSSLLQSFLKTSIGCSIRSESHMNLL